jgi:acetoin utilization deacetylase AcuC-like enzyme
MVTPIFYDQRQNVDGVDSFSSSAGKPKRFIDAALRRSGGCDIRPVTPVNRDDLLIAHKPDHIDGVFTGTALNGFDSSDERVPESCLWTCGSMATATLAAYEMSCITCSPTSGFHHASYSYGSNAYCTFNGLMVAAGKFIEVHPDARIAVIDCDNHRGDGTEDVLKHKPDLAKHILHLTAGAHFYGDEPSHEFFTWLQSAIREINMFDPHVVLYQAGGDQAKFDPLGGLLTDYELCQRDRMVFTRIRAPICWNLAGGYQDITPTRDPVIDIHLRTLAIADSAPERIKQ